MLASALRLTRIGFRALWFAAVLALLALTILPSLLRPAGFETYTVRGGSMSPTIPLGAMAVVQSEPASAVNAGDVITFAAPNNTTVTHRVVGRTAGDEPTFITQGDANSSPDPDLVPGSRVIGRVVFSVPAAGAVLVTISTLPGAIVVAALLVALMVGGWFIDGLRDQLAGHALPWPASEPVG